MTVGLEPRTSSSSKSVDTLIQASLDWAGARQRLRTRKVEHKTISARQAYGHITPTTSTRLMATGLLGELMAVGSTLMAAPMQDRTTSRTTTIGQVFCSRIV